VSLIAATLALTLVAQTPEKVGNPPQNLIKALNATGLTYSLSENKLNVHLLFDHPNKRQRKVYILTTSESLGTFTTHLVYTIIDLGKKDLTMDMLKKTVGATKKLGHFYTLKQSDGLMTLRFGAHFNATELSGEPKAGEAGVTHLKDLIYLVNQVGEEAQLDLNP
jgi:hypothetical protein